MSGDILNKIYYCMERVVVLEGIDDVLNHIVRTAATLTQADAASLRLFNMKTGQLDLRAGFGLSNEFLGQPSLSLGEGIIGSVVRDCTIFCSTDVSNDPRCKQPNLARQEGVSAILSVPLKSRDTAIGSMTVYRRSPSKFTDSEMMLMSIFAAQAVEAVQKTEQLEMLKKQASFDSLTGACNRSYLLSRLNEEIKRAGRYKLIFSMLFIDLDDFKKFNDRHGHLLGDKFLQDFAGMLRRNLRKNDIFGRYGGEEFIIVLPETNASGALTLANKLRTDFNSRDFLGNGGPVSGFSFSSGISRFPEDGEIAELLIEKADQAMYQAKRAGKNCVHIHSAD